MKKGLLAALCASTLLLGFGESSNLIEEAKNSVKLELENPDSVQFRNMKVHKVQYGDCVCGEVNEKNNMGEYTGYKRFVYLDNDIEIEQHNPNNVDKFNILFAIFCNGVSQIKVEKKKDQLNDLSNKVDKINEERRTNVENYKKGQITQYEFMKKEYELDKKRLKNMKKQVEIIKWFDEL